MPLLRSSVAGFAALALEGSLAVRIAEQRRHQAGQRTSASELRSWERSLPVLANDLVQAGLDDVEVLVEYTLPLSSKTGSRSFTQTLRTVAGAGSSRAKSLFTYFNSYMSADKNSIEVLLADEAHRIRETSVNRYTRKEVRLHARAQMDELLDVARVPVFLLDEHQVVRPGELGSVADIEAHARTRGLPLHRIELDTQFRCGGSEAYVQWVLRLLGLAPGGPVRWDDDTFQVRTAAGPAELEAVLRERLAAGFGARMTAGYCWRWSNPTRDGQLVPDVAIGGWSRPWNVKGDRSVGGAPPAPLWASADGGFEQVGCVYTAQGFEYDWNGVILGPDLVWRTDRWVPRREHNRDPDFASRTRVDDDEFARLVRNVYKVLLTRGMVGTVVTSVDEETQEMLEGLVVSAVAVS